MNKALILLFLSACAAVAQQQPGGVSTLPPTGSGGATGPTTYTAEIIIPSGGGSVTLTHNLSSTYPIVGTPAVKSGSSDYSLGAFTSSSFVVTSFGAADIVFPLAAGAAVTSNFFMTTGALSTSSVFQSWPTVITATVTLTAVGGHTATVTPSCNTITGITCSFSPSTITGTGGTTTVSITASPTANVGANSIVVSGTDGTLTNSAPGATLTVWTGPVQQWLMNEGTSPMLDSSGHTNNLTNTSLTYTNISGMLSNTPTFGGASSGSVSAATNFTYTNATPASQFSVCGWLNLGSGAGTAVHTVAANYNGTSGWVLYFAGGGGDPFIWNMASTGGDAIATFTGFEPTAGTTYQFCATADGTGTPGGLLLYVNGAAVSSSSTTGTASGTLTSAPISLGVFSGQPIYTWKGGLADFRYFGYVLNATQAAAIHAGGAQ